MKRRTTRLALRWPLLAAAALAMSVAGPVAATQVAPDAATAPSTFFYQGSAYGTTVKVGTVIKSGPSAFVTLGCTTKAGIHRVNTTAGVSVPGLLTSGTITSTADSSANPVATTTSDSVENANLLDGVVRATLVKSVSRTSRDATGFHFSSDGSTFVSLSINGQTMGNTPPPNTKIALPGIGYVILNQQIKKVTATSATFTVNALHLVVTSPNPQAPVGTDIVVAHAVSGLRGPVAGSLDGRAYGTSVQLGSVVTSGPTFLVVMPCTGTEGVLKSNTGAGITVPGVLSTGTITDTDQGTVGDTSTSETTSTVQSVDLLAGMVQATVVKADAHASKGPTGAFTFGDSGSQFATLSVQGFPSINADAPANTALSMPGLGTLYLHRIIRTPNSIEVRMIELVVDQDNQLGLPIGSDIRVAVAEASVH